MSYPFSLKSRTATIEALTNQPLDLLVIGGGVTGAGIALDAVTRGMHVAVIEMQDFAAGTSSRSTKLVHGGLRYLKQFDIGVVAEVGEERAIVYENAPHVTTPLWMMLPIIEHGTYGMFMSTIGLYIYDRLARVKPSERRQMLTKEQALQKEPLLNPEHIQGAGYYVEYRTDDARLTIEIIKEAVQRGALALNYTKAQDLLYDKGQVTGVQAEDLLTGHNYTIHAKTVVNATGPWVDQLREIDHSKKGKTLHLTKGVHIVIDGSKFPLQNPVYFDVPDGRMVFAIPRDGKTYIGTTDTNYVGDPIRPLTTKEDRDYLLNCIRFMFPSLSLTEQDVEAFWSGIRPLIHEEGKSPSEISRKDEIFTSQSQLITIAGGKLTGYRKMADKVVSYVASILQEKYQQTYGDCQTQTIELSGGKFGGSIHMPAFMEKQISKGTLLGLSVKEATRLVHRYGTNVLKIYDLVKSGAATTDKFGLSPEVFAALQYGIDEEMVVTPTDFFVRRTSAMFFDVDWVQQWKAPVVSFMADYFTWDEDTTRRYEEDLNQCISEATEVIQ